MAEILNHTILSDVSVIPCKKYQTFGDLKKQSKRVQLLVIAKMKPCSERDSLDKWIYDTYYSKKKMYGNLTMRIKELDNLICYRKIISECLNGKDILSLGTTIKLLDDNEIEYFKQLQKINPSVVGTFIDYLLRRMICEITNIPFKDSRSDRKNMLIHKCDTEINYLQKSRKELLHLCKEHNIKKYYKLSCYEMSNILKDTVKTCKYNTRGYINMNTCLFPICQKMCLEKVRNIKEYKTESILKEILIVSLNHSECFGYAPSQESFDMLIHNLDDISNIKKCIMPLEKICKLLVSNSTNILLNPVLGNMLDIVNTNIPSDADLIIDDTLIDIKCTTQDKKIYEFLQLFGYSAMCLLNPNYKIKINKIKILNIVNGTLVTYPIDFLTLQNCVSYIRLLTPKESEESLQLASTTPLTQVENTTGEFRNIEENAL